MRIKTNLKQKNKQVYSIARYALPVLLIAIVGIVYFNFRNPVVSIANTQEQFWLGTIDSNWENKENWKSNTLPKNGERVTITRGNHAPSLTSKSSFKPSRITLQPFTQLNIGAKLTIGESLILEQHALLNLIDGYVEIGNEAILENNAQLQINQGTVKVLGDLTLYGGKTILSKGAKLQVNNDLELEGQNGEFMQAGGELIVNGDLDFITDENGDGASFFQKSGSSNINGNLRFYKLSNLGLSNGKLVQTGGNLSANSITRVGQDVKFYSAIPIINLTEGELYFEDNVQVQANDQLTFTGGILSLNDELEINQEITFYSLHFQKEANVRLNQNLSLLGDIISDHTVKFIGNGSLHFQSENGQKVTGTGNLEIAKVLVGSSGLLLEMGMKILNQLSLQGTISTFSNGSVIFSHEAEYSLADNCWINCPVRKEGSEINFVYPVGDNASKTFLHLVGSKLDEAGILVSMAKATFRTEKKDRSVKELVETYSWNFVGDHSFGELWVTLTKNEQYGLAGLIDNTWTCLENEINGNYRITSDCNAIALALLPNLNSEPSTLRAAIQPEGIKLSWPITNSHMVQSYSLKKWIDGKFVEIYNVLSGFETKFNDLTNVSGNHSYRLDLVGANGYFTKGKVIVVKFENQEDLNSLSILSVYPNPINQEATLHLKASKNNTGVVSFIDQNGNNQFNQSIVFQTGENQLKLNGLGHLSAGQYLLKVSTAGWVDTRAVIKQ